MAVVVLAVLLAVSPATFSSLAADDITIAAGDRSGPFYEFGRGMCRLLTRNMEGATCSLLPAPKGDAPESYSNLVNVETGAADIGLVRSDWHYFGIKRAGPLAHIFEKLDSVRSLFSLHSRPVTLLARRDSGITELDHLAGKRVNLGRSQTDDRNSVELLMAAKKWTAEDFILAEQLPRSEQTLAFCHNRVQAMVFTATYPHEDIQRAAEICDARLVNLGGEAVGEILTRNPFLSAATIPKGTYPGMSGDVVTFGTTLTVVSSADIPADLVYAVVKTVFENFSGLQKLHPALRDLEPGRMVRDGLTAPYHIGAMRYYREENLY